MEEKTLQVGVKSREDFFKGARQVLQGVEQGLVPEKPLVGLFFEDLRTLLKYLTPKRWDLLDVLHREGPMTTHALSKRLGRHYKNVHEDMKVIESLGLIERNEEGRIFAPYDRILAELRLAA